MDTTLASGESAPDIVAGRELLGQELSRIVQRDNLEQLRVLFAGLARATSAEDTARIRSDLNTLIEAMGLYGDALAAFARAHNIHAIIGERTLAQELEPRPLTAAPASSGPIPHRAETEPMRVDGSLAVPGGLAEAFDIQARVVDDARGVATEDPAAIHTAAAAGFEGSAVAMPHAAAIKESFGPAYSGVVDDIEAHVGGPAVAAAGAIGAEAYASGRHVVFGAALSLSTAAHEAAHVVQQRDGVQLKGGLGEVGDDYERHADAVAERVVRGEPAGDLLDAGPRGGPAVQRRVVIDDKQTLSRDTARPIVDAFLDEHAGDDEMLRGIVELAINDGIDHPIATLLSDLPPRHVDDDDDGASPLAGIEDVLGELLSSGQYVFNNPPLDSSGDIYHTLGFMAVLREAGLPLPRVIIGYFAPANGESKTWLNATRAKQFGDALGFGDHVQVLELERGKSDNPNPKLKYMREAITARDDGEGRVREPIIDQKVSTALIARLMQAVGTEQITAIIRRQFTTYGAEPPAAVQGASDEWLHAQLAQIRRVVGHEKRLVLFNERIASNQPQHNSDGPEFAAIRRYIDAQDDLAHYTLRSHGEGPSLGDERSSSAAFAGAGERGDSYPEGFNTKVQHLQLLAYIKAELGDRLVGIYGSTSGTLDAAALIGIPTLSLHTFSIDAKAKTGLNEQDQRELIMGPFKSVLRRQGGDHAVEAFEEWLDDIYKGPSFDPKDLKNLKPVFGRANKSTGTRKGFKEETQALPGELRAILSGLLDPARGGLAESLASVTNVDDEEVALDRGVATGIGMNCLIHTMVQLANNAGAPPGPAVEAIRTAMIETGTAELDEMIDPYADGAGAALMEQFRQQGNFATQILQWQGGHLLVHPMIGAGPVRLLLHAGNHFVPIWGNGDVGMTPTGGVGAGDAHGGHLALMLRQAILASLRVAPKAPHPPSSNAILPAERASEPPSDAVRVDTSGFDTSSSSTRAVGAIRHATVAESDGGGQLFASPNDVPVAIRPGTVLVIDGRIARVITITGRLMETTVEFTWT